MTQSKKTITLTELESSTYGNTQYKIRIVVAEVPFFVGNPVGCSISENGFKRILLDIFYLNHFQLYCNLTNLTRIKTKSSLFKTKEDFGWSTNFV